VPQQHACSCIDNLSCCLLASRVHSCSSPSSNNSTCHSRSRNISREVSGCSVTIGSRGEAPCRPLHSSVSTIQGSCRQHPRQLPATCLDVFQGLSSTLPLTSLFVLHYAGASAAA
jgi:hypothetical protein